MKSSLRHKTNMVIFATLIPISMVVGIIQFHFQEKRFRSMLDKDKLLIETLVQRDKEALANEIFDNNIRAIKLRVLSMIHIRGIEAISIFDKNGHLILSEINASARNTFSSKEKISGTGTVTSTMDNAYVNSDIDPAEQKIIIKKLRTNRINRFGNGCLEYSQVINVIGERIGFIRIYYSLSDIQKARRQSYRIYVGLIFSIFLVMLIQLNFMLSKTVITPIKFLRDAMERLRKAKTGEQIKIITNDEIGELSETFNKMSLELARSYSEIEKQNRKLMRNEQEIKRIGIYLKNIIDSMPSILAGVDSAGRITRWNKGAEEITGISEQDARGMLFTDIFTWYGFQQVDIEKSIKNKTVQTKTKFPVIRGDQTRFFDMTIYPLLGSGLEGAVIRIDDVTEHVRLEEVMIQSEKMLSVGGLAAGMAHEINNPLAGILQNTAVIKNRLEADIPANYKAAKKAGTDMAAIKTFMQSRDIFKMLENVKDAGIRAAEIVKDMLGFARKSEGKFSPCAMDKLLDETLKLACADYNLKKHFDFKNIVIIKEYDQNLPLVFCDKSKIQQVFFNILQNGAQAMGENKKNGQSDPSRFLFRIKQEKKSVIMEIEDNGPGMEEETAKRVFEPFFTTKPVGVGTGLGMSVSYFIITHTHKGSIKVESSPGNGTKFIITLPLKPE